MEEEITIPEERIGVLIGPEGKTKKEIEKKTKTKIEVDSGTGEVFLSGDGEKFFVGRDIVKAIARGFSPERAFNLLKQNHILKVINLEEYIGKNSSAQKAKKGRIIGKDGLARKEIEKNTDSTISVYGKTVSIISSEKNIEEAFEAVKMLIMGAKHETMENFLKGKASRFEL